MTTPPIISSRDVGSSTDSMAEPSCDNAFMRYLLYSELHDALRQDDLESVSEQEINHQRKYHRNDRVFDEILLRALVIRRKHGDLQHKVKQGGNDESNRHQDIDINRGQNQAGKHTFIVTVILFTCNLFAFPQFSDGLDQQNNGKHQGQDTDHGRHEVRSNGHYLGLRQHARQNQHRYGNNCVEDADNQVAIFFQKHVIPLFQNQNTPGSLYQNISNSPKKSNRYFFAL